MTPVLWEMLKPYRWRMGVAMGLQALAGLCSLLPWILLAWWAETLVKAGSATPLDGWVLMLVVVAMALWLFSQALAAHLAHRVDADLCSNLRQQLLVHLRCLPLDWFARQGQDGVARLAEQDVRALHQLVAHAPNDLSNLLVVPWAALLCLAWLQPGLLLFCLVPLALAAGGFALLRSTRYLGDVSRRNAALERLSSDFGEFAHNLPLARQYPGAGLQHGVEASAAVFEEAFANWVKRVGHLAAMTQILLGGPWLMAWVLLGAMSLALYEAPLAIGQLCAFLLLVRAMAAPVQALGHGADALLAAHEAAQRLQTVFDQPALAEGRSSLKPVDGSVTARGLSFSYPEQDALKGVELELADGNLTALVGPSGSGKSTLLHLLSRHMDPQAGCILIGGVALDSLPESVRHQHIVLLTQQAAALELSLADNIALMHPGASHAEIRQAARDACLDNDIMMLPQGYSSVPGKDVQLSGGELQRLALARALLSTAPIWLLDEPTSATDPQTAHALHRVLRERLVGRTRLIVAHQLSEVIDADQILVLNDGRVVECGQHSHLLALDGLYARLWQAQQSERERVA
ncbi:ABC transporter ATP-binding protein [Halomonas sp. AOP35-4E-18]|uniref:ABC transporter ATP-binding protein n=1 Tax=Halomonas sp. AOP35-4E-18 TaxID=3457686 RepID=UPI004034BC4B